MAINRQNVNKNSNELAKGPFGKWRFGRKWRIWRKWQKWRLTATITKLYTKILMSWQRGLLESSNLAEMANRQIVNKNSNDMATGPFGKWRFWRKLRIKRKRR